MTWLRQIENDCPAEAQPWCHWRGTLLKNQQYGDAKICETEWFCVVNGKYECVGGHVEGGELVSILRT